MSRSMLFVRALWGSFLIALATLPVSGRPDPYIERDSNQAENYVYTGRFWPSIEINDNDFSEGEQYPAIWQSGSLWNKDEKEKIKTSFTHVDLLYKSGRWLSLWQEESKGKKEGAWRMLMMLPEKHVERWWNDESTTSSDNGRYRMINLQVMARRADASDPEDFVKIGEPLFSYMIDGRRNYLDPWHQSYSRRIYIGPIIAPETQNSRKVRDVFSELARGNYDRMRVVDASNNVAILGDAKVSYSELLALMR